MQEYNLKNHKVLPELINRINQKFSIEYSENWQLIYHSTNIAQGHFGFTCVEKKVFGNIQSNEFIVYQLVQNTCDGSKIVLEKADNYQGFLNIINNVLCIKREDLRKDIIDSVDNFISNKN